MKLINDPSNIPKEERVIFVRRSPRLLQDADNLVLRDDDAFEIVDHELGKTQRSPTKYILEWSRPYETGEYRSPAMTKRQILKMVDSWLEAKGEIDRPKKLMEAEQQILDYKKNHPRVAFLD